MACASAMAGATFRRKTGVELLVMMNRWLPWTVLLLLLLVMAAPAHAGQVIDDDKAKLNIGGDVKGFFVGIFPYDHLIMPEDPIGQGVLDFRFKMDGSVGRWLRYTFHHQASASMFSEPFEMTMSAAGGSGEEFPQAVDLSWEAIDGDSYQFNGRMDRAALTFRVPHVDITVGRQPISFGSAYFFNPMDLVAPFSPVVIDQEYKPGIDAVRADVFIGMSSKITVVGAYAGDWDWEGMILAGHGSFTVGVTDIGFFVGEVHKETVLGVDVWSALGPVGIHGEATVTFHDPDESPFVRAALGADVMPMAGLSLMAEFYYQGIGAKDPGDYLAFATSERFERGELWSMGRWYGALSASYELMPLINVNLAAIANLGDPSMILAPGMSWSVADNAVLGAGFYFAIGERPGELDMEALLEDLTAAPTEEQLMDAIPVNSEFGLSPSMAFVQMKMYF